MARTFTAQDLITLPSLSAEEATALATELVTTAKSAGKLPASVAESLDDLREAKDALAAELRKRTQVEAGDPRAAREADITLDRAWSATESWLSGWTSLEVHDHADTAKALYARLFPDGLAFLTKSFKAEWAESEARLGAIDEDKLGKTFDLLGGKAFLKQIRQAHDVYGKTLGITAAKSAPETTPQVRESRDALLAAMREYVAQVAASVRRKKPESEALATQLLRPVASWETSKRAASVATTPNAPPATAPATGTAPTTPSNT